MPLRMSLPVRMSLHVRMSLPVPMLVCRVVRVVVRSLRRTDSVLVPWQGDAIEAGVAVHPDVAVQRLVIPLDDE